MDKLRQPYIKVVILIFTSQACGSRRPPSMTSEHAKKRGLFSLTSMENIDAMLPSYTRDGRPHIEYVKDRGPCRDLPFRKIQEASILAKKM